MASPDPLATASDVSDELNGALSATGISNRWLKRAARLVSTRVPDADDWLREELEILVAAHFAYPHITGASDGTEISSVTQGSSAVSYETSDGPGGISSPYWTHAVELSGGRLDNSREFFVHTL